MFLPSGRLWSLEGGHAISYAAYYNRSHDVVTRVYDACQAYASSGISRRDNCRLFLQVTAIPYNSAVTYNLMTAIDYKSSIGAS
jgi:hypothetical protein